MCHSPAFTMWLYLREDQHPGALIARSLEIPVDSEPELETADEKVERLLKELGYDSDNQESETKPTVTEPQPTDPIQN